MESRRRSERGLGGRLAGVLFGGNLQLGPGSKPRHTLPSEEEIRKTFRGPILAGDVQAMFRIAAAYQALGDSEKHRLSCLYWLRRAAVLGHDDAMAALAAEFDARAEYLKTSGPDWGNHSHGPFYEERIAAGEARYWGWRLAAVRGPDPDYAEARQFESVGEIQHAEASYRKSAISGNPDAAFRLAKLAARREDSESASSWLSRASQMGDFRAGVLLRGYLSEQSTEDLVWSLANAGDVDCAYILAKCSRDHKWLLRAAEAGDADAAYELGNKLDIEDERNIREEYRSTTPPSPGEWCWRIAAQQGHPAAAYRLSLNLAVRGWRDESDMWLDAAARVGYTEAIRRRRKDGKIDAAVGEAGHGMPPFAKAAWLLRKSHYPEARQLLMEVAGAGNSDAVFNLGVLAEREGQPAEALRWFAEAAELNDLESCYRYGELLAQTRQAAQAEPWLQRAAEAGIEDAIYRLGALRCDAGDREGARGLWQSPVLRHHAESSFQLAVLSEQNGDLIEAKRLYRRAADFGHAEARNRHGDLVLRHGEIEDLECTWELVRRQLSPAQTADATGSLPGATFRWSSIQKDELTSSSDPGRQAAVSNVQDTDAPAQRDIQELLDHWDALKSLAPNPDRAVTFLAQHGRLPRSEVDQVRRVRNHCAHPSEHGWPSAYEVDKALATARELRRRLLA